jgi:hypothetical protein
MNRISRRVFGTQLGAAVALSGCSGAGGGSANPPSPLSSATPTPTASPTPKPSPTSSATSSAGFPAGFWDSSNMPVARNVMMFKFLNRTNGQYPDSQVFWSVSINGVTQTYSIAEQPFFDMPANSSGRIYVYLGSVGNTPTSYYDFMEYTIGAAQFNGDTTRVDAFGVKIALQLQCTDGFQVTVGENAATFAESRSATFARFIAAVPSQFTALAQQQAPYRILSPGAGGFDTGGPYADYYDAYVNEIWQSNGLTIPLPGPNGDGLAAYPDLSAAIYRHTAGPGTFNPDGTLISQSMWASSAAFYQTAPADFYAQFWHQNAVNGRQYGFPYDDVGGYSSYISHANPTYMLVAIGW